MHMGPCNKLEEKSSSDMKTLPGIGFISNLLRSQCYTWDSQTTKMTYIDVVFIPGTTQYTLTIKEFCFYDKREKHTNKDKIFLTSFQQE